MIPEIKCYQTEDPDEIPCHQVVTVHDKRCSIVLIEANNSLENTHCLGG